MSRCTDINICIPQYLFPSTAPARCARMFDDDVHMSGVHNPGAGCPIRRPSDLSAPHICSRSTGFHCTAALYNSFRLFIRAAGQRRRKSCSMELIQCTTIRTLVIYSKTVAFVFVFVFVIVFVYVHNNTQRGHKQSDSCRPDVFNSSASHQLSKQCSLLYNP